MKKYDIVNALALRHGLCRYLEICTPATGNEFRNIDRQLFETCDRLMYNCPAEWKEALPITFRAPERSSGQLVRTLVETRPEARYDIILVDGWHTYPCASLDLIGAQRLLSDGGILVVHDCDPREPTLAIPDHQTGAWCGLAYAAFLDFVLPRETIKYYTVDTDYGCGVVFTDGSRTDYVSGHGDRRALEFEWKAVGPADDDRFAFYLAHRETLLNMISPSDFLALEGMRFEGYADIPVPCEIIGEIPLLPMPG